MRGTIFFKMTGSGNDFVMLDGRFTSAERWPATRIASICDRRSGVGADGLVILTPDGPGRVRMAYWNSDGSRAAMCGLRGCARHRAARRQPILEKVHLRRRGTWDTESTL